MLTEWKCKVLCLSETWLRPTSTVDTHLALHTDFHTFRRDRPTRTHGGLLIHAHASTRAHRRHDLEHPELECITLEMNAPTPGVTAKHILFFCYRPPNQPPESFFPPLHDLLVRASTESTLITLLGDFNAKHSSWDRHGNPNMAGTRMAELVLDFGLSQIINEPTRYSSDGNQRSVLDLYCTSRPDLIHSTIISDPISDHCSVTTCFSSANAKSTTATKHLIRPDFSRVDWDRLRTAVSHAPLFLAIQGTQNVDVACCVWNDLFLATIVPHIPLRYITIRQGNQPWMTSYLHKLRRK